MRAGFGLASDDGADTSCRYDGGRGAGICEHVPFHTCLRRRGAQIGVAPFLVQGCGNGAPRPPPPAVRVRMLRNGTVIQTVNESAFAPFGKWYATSRDGVLSALGRWAG